MKKKTEKMLRKRLIMKFLVKNIDRATIARYFKISERTVYRLIAEMRGDPEFQQILAFLQGANGAT